MCVSILLGGNVIYADSHPHIMIQDNEKGTKWRKIKEETCAQEVFNSTKTRLNFYVEKHQQDTTWILERYLMNRVPGKYYTDFISDADGTQLIAYEGNAPVPTIRVSPHKRAPISPEGVAYVLPKIEDLIPNDTSMYMRLLNPVTKKYEIVDPQSYVGILNGTINELAYEASVIYWLTGETKYAKFAADILNQWVNAAVYQHPIKGPGRTGFLNRLAIDQINPSAHCPRRSFGKRIDAVNINAIAALVVTKHQIRIFGHIKNRHARFHLQGLRREDCSIRRDCQRGFIPCLDGIITANRKGNFDGIRFACFRRRCFC